jgi:SAM-dependent methyltransferase
MIRYLGYAAAFKAFSATRGTRRLYRRLGNTRGAERRARAGLPDSYLCRAKDVLELANRHRVPRPQARLLELGTGWLPWESTVLRLVYDLDATLFDVWDNRQWDAFRVYFASLADRIDSLPLETAERTRVSARLGEILGCRSFPEVYALLGFEYVVDSSGSLASLEDESMDVVLSVNTLEHVDRSILPQYVLDIARVLRPGGVALHTIDLDDHLADYDGTVSRKQYMAYSDRVWRLAFQSAVHYYNRVQSPEWRRLFGLAGLELVEEHAHGIDLDGLRAHRSYACLDPVERSCVELRLVYRKPT